MQFIQSIRDFPQMVTLGAKTPSFGLHRFKQGLRFVPFDDEGFTLRGDKQRLNYKGRRRSHRFTILGDGSFEYDCILNREPESNVIRLRIEGAENFNFFRQPDFVENPFLQGSYAVYKKQTLLGEGTGKLCHIHRPEIIDARGRRCWGKLAVVGNELRITIPEEWLADAQYPVVVDPTVGTTTIGSQYTYRKYNPNIGGYVNTVLNCSHTLLLNKVLITESIGSNINFNIYKGNDIFVNNDYPFEIHISDSCPCIYNNNVNNLPENRISINEQLINDPYKYYEAGWLQAGISRNCPINEGDYIWFGVRGVNLYLRFDFGGVLESYDVSNQYYYKNTLLPDVLGDAYYSPSLTTVDNREILISMYLTYEGAGNIYKKTLVEKASVDDTTSKALTFFRKCVEIASLDDRLSKMKTIFRKCVEIARLNDTTSKALTFFRKCVEIARLDDSLSKMKTIFRKCVEIARLDDSLSKMKTIFRKCIETARLNDTTSRVQTLLRKCIETARINMTLKVLRILKIICSIFDSVRTDTRVFSGKELYIKITDVLKANGSVVRRLFISLRILSNSFVRSYLIKRFLNAKIEITIKSRIGGGEKLGMRNEE